MQAPSDRFTTVVTDEEISNLANEKMNANTKNNTKWAVGVFNQWRSSRAQSVDPIIELHMMNAEFMNYWLERFVMETRKQNGDEYPPKSLYYIVCGLFRHCRAMNVHDKNFLDMKDGRFAHFRRVLEAQMKDSLSKGLGTKVRREDPVSDNDEDKLWANGVFVTTNSTSLQYTVFFYNCKLFGLRGRDKHRNLDHSQFETGQDATRRFMRFIGRNNKTFKGGLGDLRLDNTDIKHYARGEMATCSKTPRLTCSNENQNYVTLDKLMKEVAEPVVRKRFDKEFDPTVLQATLNRESLKLKKLVNKKQWSILFPPRVPCDFKDKKPVCSSDFDLTFMILLIRNLTPIQISDTLPVSIDISPGADISRIKYYRNELAHCNGKISDIVFEQLWVEIYQAIVRLGGESYKEMCAQLRITSLSSGRRYGMKNIHQEIIKDWKETEIKIVETNTIKELMKLTKKSNFIAVIGPSGCGKSTAAHQVALLLHRNDGYQIVPSNFPTDITHYYNESEKQVFVFDDVCGKYSLDYDLFKKWKKLNTELNKIKQCENVIIMVSSRSDIFYQLKDVQFLFTTHFDMLSNDYRLCENERFLMAKAHIGSEKAEILRESNLFNKYDFFPLLCQIFATDKERNILKFFSHPVKVIKEELTLMKEEKDQTSFAVFALFVIYNNRITNEVLSPTSGIKTILSDIAEECELSSLLNIKVVRKNLNIFLHSYVKKIGSSYMIMHDKLFDIFVSFYGEHLLDIILNHCSYPVLFTRFQLQSVEDTDEYMIKIPVEKEEKYFQRLFHPSDLGDFANIFLHNHLKSRPFNQQLLKFLSEDPVCRDLCRLLSDTESSPLLITAARGDNYITKVLLDMGMNVNVCDDFELTPLAYASGRGYLETVKLLLENNGDTNKQHKHKQYFTSNLAEAQLYFVCYYSYSITPSEFFNALHNLCKHLVNIFKDQQKNDEDLVSLTYTGKPLLLATAFGHTDIVRVLLKQDCDIDPHDWFPITPLYLATFCNHVEIVNILLEHGCDINRCYDENESPLYVASKRGYVDIVKLLLDKNCDIKLCNKNRESPLHAASKCIGCVEFKYDLLDTFWENFEIVLRLFNRKKMKVSNGDYVEIVKLLLMHNADVNICNKDGKTPMAVALENGHSEIMKLLSEHSTVKMHKE